MVSHQHDHRRSEAQIEECVNRNSIDPNNIKSLGPSTLADDLWKERLPKIARDLVRDRVAIKHGILPKDMEDLKTPILEELKAVQDLYFKYIRTDKKSGYRRASCYSLTCEGLMHADGATWDKYFATLEESLAFTEATRKEGLVDL